MRDGITQWENGKRKRHPAGSELSQRDRGGRHSIDAVDECIASIVANEVAPRNPLNVERNPDNGTVRGALSVCGVAPVHRGSD
jgi:hypothetical protein